MTSSGSPGPRPDPGPDPWPDPGPGPWPDPGPGPWPDPGPGPWRHRLAVPALDLAAYARINRMTLARLRPARRWTRVLAWVLAGCAVGGLGGAASAMLGAGMMIEAWTETPPRSIVLDGLQSYVALLGLVLLTILALRIALGRSGAGLLRRLHARSGRILGPHTLLLGDHGLAWISRDGMTALRWEGVEALDRQGDAHLLLLGGASFLWLPDAALPAGAEGEGVADFIRARLAASRGG